MTVNYNKEVSSVNSFTFLKLLATWRGSIWKSIKWELVMWLIAFAIIQCVYRYLLSENQQNAFEDTAIHLNAGLVHIPLTFMLGFFVTIVIDRWRTIFLNIAFIDSVALCVGALVTGADHTARVLRRTIIRYLVISQILVLRDISVGVRRRFPKLQSLVTEGFLYNDELEKLRNCKALYTRAWLPTHWANQLVHDATIKTKTVDSPPSMNAVLMNIKEFRQSMEMLTKYDWVPIPIAYPQVVFLAVRVYFAICLISRQYLLSGRSTEVQSVFPILTILEFMFFVGWMKVAERLLNPLGEDDDDFECNWLIDRNMATGIEIVDTYHDSYPELKLDEPDDDSGNMYWSHPKKNASQALPTAVAITRKKHPFGKVLHMVRPFKHAGGTPNASSTP